MLILVLGILTLLFGYLFYSRFLERMFMPFRDQTPAVAIVSLYVAASLLVAHEESMDILVTLWDTS